MQRRYKVVAAVGAFAAAVAAYGFAVPSANAEARAVPQRFQIVQMNLCGHQVNLGKCFNRPGSGKAMTPRKKRNEAVRIIKARNPNAVTLNEVCVRDARRIADRTNNYELRFTPVKSVSRCSKGRGRWGIALLAKNFNGTKVFRGRLPEGPTNSHNRWMCAKTASKVLVCTSHLHYGAHADDPDDVRTNEVQCNRLKRRVLTNRRPPVVFGGDVNRHASDGVCRKDSMWGRSDWDTDMGTARLQHIYVDKWAFDPVADHGWVRDMTSTDHPAFGVKMRRS